MRSIGEIINTFLFDKTGILLLLTNFFVVVQYLEGIINIEKLIFLFLVQTLLIGCFQFLKIVSLRKFTTDNYTHYTIVIPATFRAKIVNGLFFLFHFLFYLFVLFIIMYFFSKNFKGEINFSHITLINIFVLFSNHAISFLLNFSRDSNRILNLGAMVTIPYLRVIPFNAILVILAFGVSFFGISNLHILILLILKITIDYVSHILEHRKTL